jgi:outer membrane protein insertion porin family
MDHPLHISSIRIPNPPKVTRPGFLSSLISPFISPISTSSLSIPWLNPAIAPISTQGSTSATAPHPPQTLHDILLTTKALTAHLRKFDIFHDDIEVKFQPAEGGAVGDVDMILGVREKGRLFLKGGTEIGGGEGGAVSGYNIFSGASDHVGA